METPLALPTIAWIAFAIGSVFGAAAQRSNFCTMGAVADILLMGDWTRLRMWALAVLDRQGVGFEAGVAGDGQAGGGVEPARQQDEGARFGHGGSW